MNAPTTRLIKLPEVLSRTRYKRSWVYRLISENRFPQPIRLGSRAIAFIEAKIDQWITDRILDSRNYQIEQ